MNQDKEVLMPFLIWDSNNYFFEYNIVNFKEFYVSLLEEKHETLS